MAARTPGLDVGPLGWVKGEIDLAMTRGAAALAAYAAAAAQGAARPEDLRAAREHLHQAHGALQIVGLEGITRVSAELEALVTDMNGDQTRRTPAHFAIAERGFREIVGYLDALMQGAPDRPLKLLPLLAALLEARGAGRADPADLYFPSLAFRPPQRERPGVSLHPEELRQYLREQRARFLRGLLAHLKSEASGPEEMRAAVEAIEGAHSMAAQRTFWWVALAFHEALALGALGPAGSEAPGEDDALQRASRLCNRIEQQIRRLVDGSHGVPERLMRELLYLVARAQPATEHIRAVKDTFQLAATLPQEEASGTTQEALRGAAAALAHAREAWDACCSGDVARLAAFRDAVRSFGSHAGVVGQGDLQALAAGLSAVGDWLSEDRGRMNEALALEASTALLLAQSGLTHVHDLGPDFTEQAGVVCSRLHGCIEGTLLRTAIDIPFLDEMSRRAQEHLIAEQTVAGMQAHLRTIERTLDGYFRNPADRSPLATLAEPLEQLDRALGMLGEARARETLQACVEQLCRFGTPDYAPSPKDFEAVAQTLAGLGFYLEALTHGTADLDEAMQPVSADAVQASHEESTEAVPADEEQPSAGPLAEAPPPPLSDEALDQELVATYLEEAAEILTQVDENRSKLASDARDTEALVAIRRGFHTLKGSGRMVGLKRLGEAAWAVEQTLNFWLQEGRAADPSLVSFIAAARRFFSDAVHAIREGRAPPDDGPIVEQAGAARRGSAESAPPVSAAEGVGIRPPEDVPAVGPATATAEAAPIPQKPQLVSEEAQEEYVELGGERISKTLFTLFAGEAHLHLGTLNEEHENLKVHGVITDAMLHAAHTLTGIVGTVGLAGLRDLVAAFERALQTLALGPLSDEESSLVAETIEAIGGQVLEALEMRRPAPAAELISRLQRVAPPDAPVAESAPDGSEPTDVDGQILAEFLEEAGELLASIGEALRQWRDEPDNMAPGQQLRRVVHTLKGSARMAGAMALGEAAHRVEDRIEQGAASGASAGSLLEALENEIEQLAGQVERLRAGGGLEEEAPAGSGVVDAGPPGAPSGEGPVPDAAEPAAAREAESERSPLLRVRTDLVDRMVNEAGEVAIARSRVEAEMRSLRDSLAELTDNVSRLRRQLRDIEIQTESQMHSRMEQAREASEAFDPLELDRFTQLQELTRMMAESVNDVHTVQQALMQGMHQAEAALAAQARQNRELQHDLMRIRMVPVSSLADRLHRVVRQTARELGKRANLDIHGGQVSLDRSVLERMTAPLEHMLRNAVMHGLEPPAERAAAGKPALGEIRLDVSQEGNEVLLALSDDGRGLDIARIRERALERGLTGGRSDMSDAALADLIFLPAFSTAQEVSEIAGRGVGMDVVRSEVAGLGGRVQLGWRAGAGTRFACYLPLTLAVSRAVIVKCGASAYALPTVMVEQVAHTRAEQLEQARSAGEMHWEGRRYAFRALADLLRLPGHDREAARRARPVLFLRSGSNAAAIEVEEIVASGQELVLKPIGPQLARVPGVTGASLLGTGDIVLLLNPVALALRETSPPAAPAAQSAAPGPSAPPVVLVVDDSLTVRKITGRLLERHGWQVLTARDGVEALEVLRETRPRVMLVDIEMPRMDGYELTRNVRAQPALAGIPIVMITSRAADKHQAHARELGVDAYLGKPYQEEELIEHLTRLASAGRSA